MQAKNFLKRNQKHNKWAVIPILSLIILALGGLIMKNTPVSEASPPQQTAGEPSNYKDGRFINTLPAKQPPLLETTAEWIKGAKNTTPSTSVPVVQLKKEDFSQFPASGLRIIWLGHSTTLVEIDGACFLLDPMWSDRSSPVSFAGPKRFFSPPLAIDDLPYIDAVLISHDHYDHLDKTTVIQLAEKGVQFIVPLKVGDHLRCWDIPDSQIIELDW